jgi:hypothetical protein
MWNLLWGFVDCMAMGYVTVICLRNSLVNKLNIFSLLTLTMKMEAASSSKIQ